MVPNDTLISVNSDRSVVVPIIAIRDGMLVVTHTREQRQVIKTLVADYEGDLYGIKVYGFNKSLRVTAEHQFLTYHNLRLLNGVPETSILGTLADRNFDYSWKRAMNLDEGDYLQVPTPYYRKNWLVVRELIDGYGGFLPNSQGLFVRIKEIIRTPHRGKLYALGVNKDNSYIANGFTVRTA